MSTLDTLRMPDHSHTWDEPDMQDHQCKGSVDPGWAEMDGSGYLTCSCCGWRTPEPAITAYSQDTGQTYLTWSDLVAAEANGYVVVGVSSRYPVPAVVGPWEPSEAGKQEARKAQARLRAKWKRQEGHTVKVFVRVLWKDSPRNKS